MKISSGSLSSTCSYDAPPPTEKPPDAPRLLSRASVVVLKRNDSKFPPLEGDISLALRLDVGDFAPPILVGELTDCLRDRLSDA